MRSEKITFEGAAGAMLAARLDLPEGAIHTAAIFAHCFTCSKDIAAARRIAARLAMLGIAILRFDFTGLGHSGGEFSNTNFSSNVGDLLAANRWMQTNNMPVHLLVGHSLGGAAVIKAAPQIDTLRAVVTIGAPADPGHVAHNFGNRIDEINSQGHARVQLAGREFEIQKQFLDDIASASLADALPRLKAALLVLHAPLDNIVGIDNASAIFKMAKHPKSFVTLDDADHLVSREADAEYAATLIVAWASRYLQLPEEAAAPDVPEAIVRVAEADANGFRQDIVAGSHHRLVADEPLSFGGTNLGPSPYQLLSAALGACTTMTVRMYARRKKLPLTHVSCDVTHDKVHAQDCQDCETKQTRVDLFQRKIRLEGDLSAEQREALLAIADKCPVHRTLHGQARIETSLV